MTTMRAKLRVGSVSPTVQTDGVTTHERLVFHGVAANSYPNDGSDEDNTYAKFSPSALFDLTLANPDLIGKFAPGDTFYVDFTPID
ncbi:hypothetical protein [Brevundimonas sp. SL161]|uniref:hypothetical protein n=1 Tax=Brevundimonas sp. SL161 TaxID=2804613 RepID=UPI003CEE0E53